MNLLKHRDAPEPTGDEPDDADFEMPKIYEPVSFIALLLSLTKFYFFVSIRIPRWPPSQDKFNI